MFYITALNSTIQVEFLKGGDMDKSSKKPEIAIGKAIKARRLVVGLNQSELAELVSREVNSISRMELGNSLPSIALLEELAKALKCPLADLLRAGGVQPSDLAQRLEKSLTGLNESDATALVDVVEVLSTQFKKKKTK